MSKSLRILVIIHHPWDPRLGASRVYLELASQWQRAGHHVEKFCLTDAFPLPTRSRPMAILRQVLFARRAASFVRRNGARFDIVDALIGTLPFSKKRLRFQGLIVGRSVGLPRLYEEFLSSSRKRWPDQPRGKLLGRIFYGFITRMLQRNADRALRYCDLFNVANQDEKRWLEQACPGKPVIVLPYGLNDQERAAFKNASRPAAERLLRKEICFLGMWSVRKGSRDWPEIVRGILKAEPGARFAFLGTMTDAQSVLRDLQLAASESIRCLPSYEPTELPGLIANCALGLFPSYIEGFGISVIEQLAAGIPTIAYDVPGPRHIFNDAGAEFLVPAGDVQAMTNRALEILRMSESDYAALSIKCREIATQFRWEQIAAENIRQYAEALGRSDTPAQTQPVTV